MNDWILIGSLALNVLLGILYLHLRTIYAYQKKQLSPLEEELRSAKEELKERELREVELVTQKNAMDEKIELLSKSQEKLSETFKALSSEALDKSSRSFLDLAKQTLEKYQERAKGEFKERHQKFETLVKPVQESLSRLDQGMHKLEKERKGEHEVLREQMRSMLESERLLRNETSSLAKALRAPSIRGQWGEMQLKRVVELSGMINHCDFYEQEVGDEGRMRPDLIVRLPGDKQVIIDAKTPIEAYLEAHETEDEDKRQLELKRHARHLRKHVTELGKKAYWNQFQPTPEFVVLFIPSESFFSSALDNDPSLIELGVENGVIIATPTTLIGLLRAIAYGWKQESLSRHAYEISELGHELYKRLADMRTHWTKIGRGLSQAVDSYNKATGSLETRVFVSARKLKDYGVSRGKELDPVELIERIPREITAPEFSADESTP